MYKFILISTLILLFSASLKAQDNPVTIINALIEKGYKIISLEITSSSIDIRELKIHPDEKICLILGSEKEGINQDLLNISDHSIHIPMHGQNSSMNVATACAITCWQIISR
jgi:tRNA G18 (ribose-2'-O)-methylase SpoU